MRKRQKFPLPKKYWAYLALMLCCAVVIFVNIFIIVDLTDEKELWEFTRNDWVKFAIFLVVEFIFVVIAFLFAMKGGKIVKKVDEEKQTYLEEVRFLGIEPENYYSVWFDFSGWRRALILQQGDVYELYVEEFEDWVEQWLAVNTVSVFNSLEEIKKTLYHEFGFFCDENTEFDKYEEEIYKGS